MLITTSTLILDKKKSLKNIESMANKANKYRLIFRPHFKTHKSAEIGNWFRNFGVNKITVSSVEMAKYFADANWNDITIATPVNILETEKINLLAKKIKLNLLLESIETASFLNKNIKYPVGIFIKIDTGYHRTGIAHDNTDYINEIINSLYKNDLLNFKGFLTHSGHTYKAKSTNEILKIHNDTISKMSVIKEKYKKDYPQMVLSIGDTPSCSLADNFEGIDEIRPGNFVFYDVMQYKLGSCNIENIAVAVACPVIAKHSERNEIIINGGAIHFSKEYILDENNNKIFGLIVNINAGNWSEPVKEAYLSNLTQEVGIIKANNNFVKFVNVGDVIGILPVHSCLTVNCMKSYLTFDDEKIKCFS